ncbi:YDG domain-containing protein [Massilia sp. LXY-6]|uniref:YDG domain-containing protein n=1 Tax=Massilia sp. LXY-6 TaxID=3379823 RepID=UPI003EE23E75
MNHIYRIVWNACMGMWQVVSECASGRTKASSTRSRKRRQAAVLALAAAGGAALAADPLPTGGRVVAGQASIQYAGQGMTVNQTSAKAALDWTGFSVGQSHTVNFVQPSSTSVALNRVLGADPSLIQGALKANGHVFLINPNGVLFAPTAQVNVGGLLASTLSMSNDDFLAGRYHLAGSSAKAVENQGSINAAAGGNIALVAAKVSNTGQLAADSGNVLLGAGSEVLVDFGGAVKLQVQKGALDALVENGGAIRADGGTVLMTAKSASELSGSVINNSGIVQARTLASGEQGKILLLGDMQSGTLHAGGTLDASAPKGGNGGAIETSAAHVDTAAGLVVNAGAAHGTGGAWLIDPYDYTIDAASASTIVNSLNQGTSVTVSTQVSEPAKGGATATGSGDITVASRIAKTAGADATLTLQADRNIFVNSDITSASGKLNLNLSSANAPGATVGGVVVSGNLKSNGGNIVIGGGNVVGGIGFALNTVDGAPAVTVDTGKSILSNGGNITISGRSTQASKGGSYTGVMGGVYVKSSAVILSSSGNLLVNARSDGSDHVFAMSFEGLSNTVTTVGSSPTGGTMLINAVNATPGSTAGNLEVGAVGLATNGNSNRILLQGPSVGNWLIYINGAPRLSAYTQSPQVQCSAPYANCGTMVVPGSNNSYLYATYQAVSASTQPIYMIQSGSGTKVYDGSTTATGLAYTTLGAPTGFSAASLAPAPIFYTAGKNVGAYDSLTPNAANASSYTSGGTTYAVGYFSTGSYTITPKTLTPNAANKIYDGNTTAAVTLSGLVAGDAVTASGSGNFAGKDVGTYAVSIGNIALGGLDAGNYTLSGNSASATASITPRTVTLSASKTYDGNTSLGGVTVGNLVSGEKLSVNGATANSANVASALYIDAITLADGANGLASNYRLPGLDAASSGNTASIVPKALSIGGLAVADKVYDGTLAATVSGGILSGLVGNESLGISALAGAFADKNAGTGKGVTLSAVSLRDGTGLASNYTFSQPTGLTGTITPKALSVSGITASDKVYDGSTSASVSTASAIFTGLVQGDAVSVSASGSFADKNAGNGKTVALTSSTGGLDAGNYSVTGQTSTTASITPKALSISGLGAASKTYDGTASATLTGGTLAGLVEGESLNLGGLSGSFADKNAGVNKTVTVSGGALSDGTGLASNYSLSLPASVTGSIGQKGLTVSGITASDKVYDGSTSASVSTSSASLVGLVQGDDVRVSASGAFADKNAGSGKTVALNSSIGGADAANYSITGQASTTASITPKALSVSGITAADKVYDGTTSATVSTAGATFTGLVHGDAVSVSASGSFADKNAGSGKTVALTSSTGGLDAANYSITGQTSTTASITPKALSISGLGAASKTYDGTASATLTGGTLAGLVEGESLNLGGLSGSFADKNAGANKTVTVSGGALSDGTGLASNYSLSLPASVTGSIGQKGLTVSGITASDKVYDGSTSASVSTASASLVGLVQGDKVNLSATGAFADKNAGSGKTVALTSSTGGLDAANYSIAGQTSTTASITPKALSISGLGAASKTYDGTASATLTGGTLAGLVEGESLNLGGLSGSFADKNAGANKTVTVSGGALADGTGLASNYSLTLPGSVVASIYQKKLSVAGITASDKVYDGSTSASVSASGANLQGLVQGDDVRVGATGAFADKNAGSGKTVALTSSTGGLDAANYSITAQASTTASITPKALSVSGITASDKVYDGTTSATVLASGVTLQGLITGDDVSVRATGAFADKNAGSGKTVALNSSIGGLDAANYSITGQASTTASITPKTLAVSGITAADKVYDGSTSATVSTAGATLTGLVHGDDVSVSATGAFADQNAGSGKTVALTSSTGGLDAANYAIVGQTSATASITPKALSITGMSVSDKMYDGTTSAPLSGGSLSGLVGGETLGFFGAVGTFADKNAGSGKNVTVTGIGLSDGTGLASNYSLSQPTGLSGAIMPKALGVSGITASDKVYDGTTAATVNAAKAVLNGLVAGDDVSVSVSGAFADQNAGKGKTVTLSSRFGGLDAANYAITGQAGTNAGITPKALSISGLGAASKTYDGSTAATLTGGTLAGLVGDETLTLGGLSGTFADKNVGTDKAVAVSGGTLSNGSGLASNYSLTLPGSVVASIGQKALTVSGITAADRVYDGSTSASVSASGASLQGLVQGDDVRVSATGAFADQNAGKGKTVTLNSSFGGLDAPNYAITGQASATASITPKALSVTGLGAASKTYDGSTAATLTGGTLTGLVGDETLTLGGLSGSFADKNAGTGKTVTVSGGALSNGSGLASNYSLTLPASVIGSIGQKALTVSGIAAADKVYDGSTSASVSASGASLQGLVQGDDVRVSATGTFADKNAGSGKTVALHSSVGGADAANYSITGQASTTASIKPKAMSVSGITALDKIYDGSTTAAVSTAGASLQGLVQGDDVRVSASGSFADKNAGSGKTVALSSSYAGRDAANYAIAGQGSATATITPKALAVSGTTVADKTADGTTGATLSAPGILVGVLVSDNVGLNGSTASAQFVQAAPGTGIAVNVSGLALSGTDAGNYAFPGMAAASGTIRPASIVTPTPVPTPTPAPVPAPAPAAATSSAVAAAIAPPQNQGIVSVLQAPAMGGMSYLAVPEQGAAPAAEPTTGVSATERRQSSTQAPGAGRDVKFLDVLVVSGGIRMPAAGKDAGEQ